ncbi:MAG: DEAD/DEAH box helicase [Treponema sp.]|nr:DEAD/DEAH box helicase [Candidatus Treponema equifaecale]
MNDSISNLPIFPYLSEICQSLKNSSSRFLVLTAETAAGKSTAVPLALLENFSGKILMLEPRRLAATAIADRLSELLGEETGKTVGYRLHLDSKIGKETRLEVITEAILTRRLQADPLLEDVNVIVLDEFHERSIHSDLALAFLKETMELRDDLFVVVMSATIDYQSLAEYLGTKENPAPVLKIPGRQFPVEIKYCDNQSISQVVGELLTNDSSNIANKKLQNNSILVFLPGIYEITRIKSQLEEQYSDYAEILILHSSVPLADQRKVLTSVSQNSKRRIILSSAIAETSLTVPGVSVVIDSGLCRTNKMNLAIGMERLVTEKESQFSADQRAGRAGRLQAGTCYRLWNKNDVRLQKNTPEILRADLTQLVLECAQWGVFEKSKLSWLDEPTESAWNSAKNLLENLDFIKEEKITEKGKAALKLGLHPRLANVLLCGGKNAVSTVISFSEYAESKPEVKTRFENDLKRRLNSIEPIKTEELAENSGQSGLLLAGYPDRLARKCENNTDSAEYQFPSGRKAILQRKALLELKLSDFPQWIVAPKVDAGEKTGKIYSFEAITEEEVQKFLNKHSVKKIVTEFAEGTLNSKNGKLTIKKTEILSYGELILKETRLNPAEEDFSQAVFNLVRTKGFEKLPSDSQIESLLLRTEFYIARKSKESLNASGTLSKLCAEYNQGDIRTFLQENVSEWLGPFISGQKIDAKNVYDALYWYLEGSEIDSEVPLQLILPNGRKRKIVYEVQGTDSQRNQKIIQPVIEIIIQQIFGCFETPKIMGVPVLLKLLSPASRPLQITDNLEHFWEETWPEICKEMKGRYPKHNWDYRLVAKD